MNIVPHQQSPRPPLNELSSNMRVSRRRHLFLAVSGCLLVLTVFPWGKITHLVWEGKYPNRVLVPHQVDEINPFDFLVLDEALLLFFSIGTIVTLAFGVYLSFRAGFFDDEQEGAILAGFCGLLSISFFWIAIYHLCSRLDPRLDRCTVIFLPPFLIVAILSLLLIFLGYIERSNI